MASLLTAAEKTTCNDAMDDLHDTFARNVTVYKDSVITVSTPSQSYNTIYGNAGSTTPITYTPQSSTVSARILYGKNYTEDYFSQQPIKFTTEDLSPRRRGSNDFKGR